MGRTKVLIVDDSAAVRLGLSEIFQADPRLDVIGTANGPEQAVTRMRAARPDVITLDVEMPGMDGLTFLRKIMSQHPIPVVMCSTLMEAQSKTLLDALQAGAVDVIQKPRMGAAKFIEHSAAHICDTIVAAAQAKPRRVLADLRPEKKLSADEILPPPTTKPVSTQVDGIVAIGASTGGTDALQHVISALPPHAPPIVVVQHMPRAFTGAFAKRLNGEARVTVREAQNRDMLKRGLVLIAPGGIHCLVGRHGREFRIELRDGPAVARHKPSVDVLFRSVAMSAGAGGMGVILTGMGDDGARGLREMRDAGAATLGQDEASSVVYGMPKAAFENGAVETQIALSKVASRIVAFDAKGRSALH